MQDSKRSRAPLLVVGAVGLIALTAVLLLSLRAPHKEPLGEENAAAAPPGDTVRQPGQPAQPRYRVPSAPVPRPRQPAAASSIEDDDPLPPPGRRGEAPAAIPAAIQNETDPVKKAELLRMHRLTTARVRVSMLRRRRDMLRSSLAQARQQGTWTPNKIQDAQRQLDEVQSAVSKAEERLDQVRQEVGGDIDKGQR